jgi:hypothetical protein
MLKGKTPKTHRLLVVVVVGQKGNERGFNLACYCDITQVILHYSSESRKRQNQWGVSWYVCSIPFWPINFKGEKEKRRKKKREKSVQTIIFKEKPTPISSMISIKVPILPFNGLTLWRCDRDRPREILHRPLKKRKHRWRKQGPAHSCSSNSPMGNESRYDPLRHYYVYTR